MHIKKLRNLRILNKNFNFFNENNFINKNYHKNIVKKIYGL